MNSLGLVCALVLCASVAAADMLPPGSYVQHGEGGDHAAASFLGGYVVVFDGQPFFWNGSFYTNGLSELEIIELLDGEYAWILAGPGGFDTGVVAGVR